MYQVDIFSLTLERKQCAQSHQRRKHGLWFGESYFFNASLILIIIISISSSNSSSSCSSLNSCSCHSSRCYATTKVVVVFGGGAGVAAVVVLWKMKCVWWVVQNRLYEHSKIRTIVNGIPSSML